MGSLQSLRSFQYGSQSFLFESSLDTEKFSRGPEIIFRVGEKIRTQHAARKVLEQVRRFKSKVRPGEYVDYDVYGRGSSGGSGKKARAENRREANSRPRRAQSRKEAERCEQRQRSDAVMGERDDDEEKSASSGLWSAEQGNDVVASDVYSTPVGDPSGSLRTAHRLNNVPSATSVVSDVTSVMSDVPQSTGREATYEEYGDEALVTKVYDDTDGESDFQSSGQLADLRRSDGDVASEAPSFLSSLQQDGSTFQDYEYADTFSMRDTSASRFDEFSERRMSVGSHYVNPSRATSDAATVENWDNCLSFGEEGVEEPSLSDIPGAYPGHPARRVKGEGATPRLSAEIGEYAEESLLNN